MNMSERRKTDVMEWEGPVRMSKRGEGGVRGYEARRTVVTRGD